MTPTEHVNAVKQQGELELDAVQAQAKRVVKRFGRQAVLKVPGAKAEPLDPMTGAKQLLELEAAFRKAAEVTSNAVMAQVDALYASGVSLAEAARQLGISGSSLKERHLRWRERYPHLAHRESYREKDPQVFLTALRAWAKENKGQVPTHSVEVPHPEWPGEMLQLGFWIGNQRTARRGDRDRKWLTAEIDKILPGGWDNPRSLNDPAHRGHPRVKVKA